MKQEEFFEKSKPVGIKRKRIKQLLIVILCVVLLVASVGVYIFYHYYNMLDRTTYDEAQGMSMDDSMSYEEDTVDFYDSYSLEADEASEEEAKAIEAEMQNNLEGMQLDSGLYKVDAFNLLLIGVDSRSNNYSGRSDAMILMSINKDTKRIVMTSILRDTYVSIPGHGNNRLNAAYAFGGETLLVDTIKANFGIEVDKCAVVNFYIVMDLVNAVGGVDINLPADVLKATNNNIPEINRLLGKLNDADLIDSTLAGTKIHLNGKQALAYARVRYVGTDFARTDRQREVIMLCLDKIKDMSIFEINTLARSFLPRIRTNLSELECASLLLMMPNISSYRIEDMRIPIDGSWNNARINGMAVLTIDFKKNTEAWYDLVQGE